jgi:hypothetical protein
MRKSNDTLMSYFDFGIRFVTEVLVNRDRKPSKGMI